MATARPSRASRSTTAEPMPPEPPVTSATRGSCSGCAAVDISCSSPDADHRLGGFPKNMDAPFISQGAEGGSLLGDHRDESVRVLRRRRRRLVVQSELTP